MALLDFCIYLMWYLLFPDLMRNWMGFWHPVSQDRLAVNEIAGTPGCDLVASPIELSLFEFFMSC